MDLPGLLIKVLAVEAVLVLLVSSAINAFGGSPAQRAVIGMALLFLLLWVVFLGYLMYRFRDRVKAVFSTVPLPWPVKFIAFGTLLVMLEELITTAMTNLAPVFGVPFGSAYITASGDYFDVIFNHSVVIIFPWFFAWAFLLWRRSYDPRGVALAFGVTGMVGEASTFGLQNLLMGQWLFVYGLMIWLPAYCMADRKSEPAKWYHYLLAVPASYLTMFPVLLPFVLFHLALPAGHPPLHFPPIR